MRSFHFSSKLGAAATACLAALLLAAPARAENDNDSDRDDSRKSARDENRSAREQRDDNDSQNRSRQRTQSNRQQGHVTLGVMLYNDDSNPLEIRRVLPDSAAEEAGLERGDEILSVNGRRVSNVEQLQRQLARADRDEECEIGILRDGRKQTVDASPSAMRSNRGRRQWQWSDGQNGNQQYRDQQFGQSGNRGSRRSGNGRAEERGDRAFLGIALDEWSEEGVRVSGVYPESPAEEAGLRRGDEIVAVDDDDVQTSRDLQQLLSQKEPDDKVTISVERNGRQRTLHATLASQREVIEASRESYRIGRRDSDRDRRRDGASGNRRQRDDSQDDDDKDGDNDD